MPENIAQTVQKAIQDLVAPEVRELKVLVTALHRQIDQRFAQVDQRFAAEREHSDERFDAEREHSDQRFDALKDQSDVQFKALMAALGEFKAQSELTNMRIIAALSERVAVLEARHQ